VEVASRAALFARAMRQKNQVELNLGTGAKGEAPSAAAQASEARAAEACLESPAVETAHRATGARSLPGKRPGADPAHARGKPCADRQGTVRLSARMARLLRLLPNPVGIART